MATEMASAMVVWMRYRGHSWAATMEMALAMYVPFVILFIPLWLGAASSGVVMTGGHVLMLLAMAIIMLRRPDEYGRPHGRHAESAASLEAA